MRPNNTVKTVQVHVWQGTNPHISLEIKTNDRSSYYFSYSPDRDEKFADTLYTDQHNFGNNEALLTFNKLCIDDIVERYKKFKKYADRDSGNLGSLSSVDFVDELLVRGGLKELSNFYVSTPTLVKSFVLLIAGGLLLLADNDMANLSGILIFTPGVYSWTQGCYQRSSRDCFKKRTLSVAEYCKQRLIPAHQLDAKRVMPLLKNRNELGISLGLCAAGLILAGVILLVLPEEFILDRKTAMGSGVVAIAAGYLLACACYQFYCVKSTPERRREEKRLPRIEIALSPWVDVNRQNSPPLHHPLLTIVSLEDEKGPPTI